MERLFNLFKSKKNERMVAESRLQIDALLKKIDDTTTYPEMALVITEFVALLSSLTEIIPHEEIQIYRIQLAYIREIKNSEFKANPQKNLLPVSNPFDIIQSNRNDDNQ